MLDFLRRRYRDYTPLECALEAAWVILTLAIIGYFLWKPYLLTGS